MLDKVEALLRAPGGLGLLGFRELKVIPYLIWGANAEWRDDRVFIRRYLSLVDAKWPTGAKRLWRHYALNFDPLTPATIEMADWFRGKHARLPELLRGFSDTYNLFDPAIATKTLGSAVISGEQLLQDINAIGLNAAVLRSSSLCVSVLAAAGLQLSNLPGTFEIIERLRGVLDGNPKNAVAEAICSPAIKLKAVRALTDGLVEWQEKSDAKNAKSDAVLDFLLALNGDPRFTPDRWHGKVSDRSIATVERWLSARTIEAFFSIIDRLKTDNDEAWKARRAFWLSYLPYVKDAWLVAGADAIPIAETQLGPLKKSSPPSFAIFEKRDGTSRSHCGLLLQIKNLCVFEMNNNGTAIFWDADCGQMPSLLKSSYNRRTCRNSVNDFSVFAIAHQGNWQRKFRSQILTMTGINVRER